MQLRRGEAFPKCNPGAGERRGENAFNWVGLWRGTRHIRRAVSFSGMVEETQDRNSQSAAGWVGWVGLGVVLYVLSTGPVIAFSEKYGSYGRIEGYLVVFYHPLAELARHCEPLNQWLNLYVRWWVQITGGTV